MSLDLSTEAGRQSALVTMTLMQMVADAYEGAQKIWDKNSGREMIEGVDDPQLFGPNEPQKAIRDWLIHAKFLPPISPTEGAMVIQEPDIESPAEASTARTGPRSKNILGLRLTTSPKPIRSDTTNSTSLPQSPVSSLTRKTLWNKIRRRSTSQIPSLPASDVNIPTCPSTATKSKSMTLPVSLQSKTQPFTRYRRFSYKRRRDLRDLDREVIKSSSDAPCRPRAKSSPNPPPIKLGPIDADTLAQLGFFFPASVSRPCVRELKEPAQDNKTSIDEEEKQPDVTLWTLCVVTALVHLFITFLFLACVFVGLWKLVRRFFSWNEPGVSCPDFDIPVHNSLNPGYPQVVQATPLSRNPS